MCNTHARNFLCASYNMPNCRNTLIKYTISARANSLTHSCETIFHCSNKPGWVPNSFSVWIATKGIFVFYWLTVCTILLQATSWSSWWCSATDRSSPKQTSFSASWRWPISAWVSFAWCKVSWLTSASEFVGGCFVHAIKAGCLRCADRTQTIRAFAGARAPLCVVNSLWAGRNPRIPLSALMMSNFAIWTQLPRQSIWASERDIWNVWEALSSVVNGAVFCRSKFSETDVDVGCLVVIYSCTAADLWAACIMQENADDAVQFALCLSSHAPLTAALALLLLLCCSLFYVP